MAKLILHSYKGMPGTKGAYKGPFINSVSQADKLLREYKIVSAAGNYGAINVWRRMDNLWGCSFMVFGEVENEKTCKTKAEAMKWLKRWIHKTGKGK